MTDREADYRAAVERLRRFLTEPNEEMTIDQALADIELLMHRIQAVAGERRISLVDERDGH